jgi:hypothetical protein
MTQHHDLDDRLPTTELRPLFAKSVAASAAALLAATGLLIAVPFDSAEAQFRPQVRQAPVQRAAPRVVVPRAAPRVAVPRAAPRAAPRVAPRAAPPPRVVTPRATPPPRVVTPRNVPPVTRTPVPRTPTTTTNTRNIPNQRVPNTGTANAPPRGIPPVTQPGTRLPPANNPLGQAGRQPPPNNPLGQAGRQPPPNNPLGQAGRPTIPTVPGGPRPTTGPVVVPGNRPPTTIPGGPLAGNRPPTTIPGGPLAGNRPPLGRPIPTTPLAGGLVPGSRPNTTVFIPQGSKPPVLPRQTDRIANNFIGSGGIARPIRPTLAAPAYKPIWNRPIAAIQGHKWAERRRFPLYFASALIITGAVVATTYRPWHRPAPTCYVGGGVFYRYPGSDTCFDFSTAATGDYFETGGKVYRWQPEVYETAEHCIEEQTTRNEVVTYNDWKVRTPAPEVERVRIVAAKAAEKPPITLATPIARDRYDCSSCLTAMGPVRGEDGQCTATVVNNCTHTVVTIGGFTKGENQAFCDFASELEPGQEVAACAQPCENFDEARAYMNIALPPEGYTGDVSQCRVIETAAAAPAPADAPKQ